MVRFERDFEKLSTASNGNAHEKTILHKAERLNPIRVSNPKLPVPTLDATRPAEAPIKHYTEKLFYRPEEGRPGPWVKKELKGKDPTKVLSAHCSLSSNARLVVDWNLRTPIVEMARRVPWQSDTDSCESLEHLDFRPGSDEWPEARVFTLAYLVHEALKRYKANDSLSTHLSAILGSISHSVREYAKNVLWVKDLVDGAKIDARSYQIDNVKRQIDRATYCLLECFFSREILAERISIEITRFERSLHDDWFVRMDHVSIELRDRALQDKLRFLGESLSIISGPNTSIAQLGNTIKHMVDEHLRPDLSNNEDMLATVLSATSSRLSMDTEPMTKQINKIISWQDKSKLGGPDPASDLLSLAKQRIGRLEHPVAGNEVVTAGNCRDYNKFVEQRMADLEEHKETVWEWLISLLDPDNTLSLPKLRLVQKSIEMLLTIYNYCPRAHQSSNLIRASWMELERHFSPKPQKRAPTAIVPDELKDKADHSPLPSLTRGQCSCGFLVICVSILPCSCLDNTVHY